ncbi:MAG: dihydrodipicolinate reductase, partial [Myxococcota bacterium]|nr:dihydrodipicolinate reductase [Myxococcota bacterium]
MTYRVIQWGTGNVGRYALRAAIGHPELDLVGLWVHSEKKEGLDAGELCGIPPVGITASRDAEALLALNA